MDLVPVRRFGFGFFGAVLVTVAAVVAVVALVLGVPVGATVGERIEAGVPSSVYVSEAGTMVWVAGGEPMGPLPCTPAGTGQVSWSMTVLIDDIRVKADGRRWRAVQVLTASPPGRYTLTCAGGGEFAVGEPPWIHGPWRWTAAAGAALLAIGGLVASVAFAVRRRRDAGSGAGGRTLAG